MKAVLATGLVLALLTVSCGGGGAPLGSDEYFVAVEETFDRAEAAMLASGRMFEGTLDAADATTEARDAAYLVLHRENRDAFAAQRAALAGLTPPEGVAAEHTEMLAALAAMLAALDGAFGTLPAAPTAEVINTALQEAGTPEANDRVMSACRALQAAAEDGGVEISLPC